MAIYQEYFNLDAEVKRKYGPKSFLLMEFGIFYEIYSLSDDKGNIVDDIAQILQIKATKKNNNKELSVSNPKMAGFNSNTLEMRYPTILEHGYSFQLYNQVVDPQNKTISRKLGEVFTPAITPNPGSANNYLMYIYIENNTKKQFDNMYEYSITAGISLIDTSINKPQVEEAASWQDLTSVIYKYSPVEVVIEYNGITTDINADLAKLYPNVIIKHSDERTEIRKKITNIKYMEDFLRKVYNVPSPIEYLNMCNRDISLKALVLMIIHLYEHSENIIKCIEYPQFIFDSSYLRIEEKTIKELDLIGSASSSNSNTNQNTKKYSSILSTIDFTHTYMGYRELNARLIKPLIDVEQILARYNNIKKYIDGGYYLGGSNDLKLMLISIKDINKLLKQLEMRRMSPANLGSLNRSITGALKLANFMGLELGTASLSEFQQMMELTFNEILYQYNTYSFYNLNDGNFFKSGIIKELDNFMVNVNDQQSIYEKLAVEFSNLVGKKDSVKVDVNKTGEKHLTTTTIRWHIIKNKLGDTKLQDYEIKELKNKAKIFPKNMNKNNNISQDNEKINDEILKLVQTSYLNTIHVIANNKQLIDDMKKLAAIVAEIDVYQSCASAAVQYNYCMPAILNEIGVDSKSQIKATGLRHPIIERISNVPYVANDVELSNESNILLYGVNMAGKSSLMRSVGVSLVMAQAGMFVAAQEFAFYPYKKLITKVSRSDDMLNGKSLFIVEVEAIRNILAVAGPSTLILADELCNGTETNSAVSLVYETINEVLQKGGQLLFTTHLHELIDLYGPQQVYNFNLNLNLKNNLNNNLSFKHLHVSVINKKIIYERTLRDGPGPSNYGITVAQSVIYNDDFILRAEATRKRLTKTVNILETKTSSYNSSVYVDSCEVCGARNDPSKSIFILDTHHIIPQVDFKNSHGIANKNLESNLVVLCKTHHKMVDGYDGKKLNINGWVQTSSGRELSYTLIQ